MRTLSSLLFLSLMALGFNSASAAPDQGCTLVDKRVCAVDTQLRAVAGGHQVTYSEGSATPGIVAEYEWLIGAPDIIHLGATALLDDDELLFVLAHEYGHSVLRHGREQVAFEALPEDKSMPDQALWAKYGSVVAPRDQAHRALFHAQELDADAFAINVMKQQQRPVVTVLRRMLRDVGASETHPGKRTRVEQARVLAARE